MRLTRRFLSAVLVVVFGTAACTGEGASPLEPQTPSLGLTGVLSAVLLQCSPLPYQTKSVDIGSGGGTVDLGVYKLVVPSGALKKTVTIRAEVVSSSVNSVRFYPEGLRFAKKAALSMSYSNCSGLGMLLPKKIVYTNELLSILEIIRSVDLTGQKVVTGQLDHFSRYAIAY